MIRTDRDRESNNTESDLGIRFSFYSPDKVVSNSDLENEGILSLSGKLLTAKRIENITGIMSRRVADEKETPLYMALKAFEGVYGEKSPDAVLTSTSYPVGFNLSSEILKEHGLTEPEIHIMDFYAACSGFSRQLKYIHEYIDFFDGKDVVLVNTEKYSPTLRGLDKAIFTDGAIASRFRVGKDLVIADSYSVTRDKFGEEINLHIQMPIERSLMTKPFVEEYVPEPLPDKDQTKFYQNGEGVKLAVLSILPGIIRNIDSEYLNNYKNGNSPDRKLIPHQGSKQIVDREIARSLPEYEVIKDYEDGNGSSMSIPRAIMRLVQQDRIKKGEELLIVGFGAGMHLTAVKLSLY